MRRAWRYVLPAWLGTVAVTAGGWAAPAAQAMSDCKPVPEEPARRVLVVSGLGGNAHYRSRFERWAREFVAIATDELTMSAACISWLKETDEPGPQTATVERVLAQVGAIGAAGAPGDLSLLLFIGHGTSRGEDTRFNLPGPDLTPDALHEALSAFEGQQLAVVMASSASGPFLSSLTAPGRIVITATGSAHENRYVRFGGAFVEAFRSPESDTDKNGRVSIGEAFDYATHRVKQIFEQGRQLQTEHALLEDGNDGQVAARMHIAPPSAFLSLGGAPPEVRRLERDAQRLLDEIESLKYAKKSLSQEEYIRGLEVLLLQLALNRRELRQIVTK